MPSRIAWVAALVGLVSLGAPGIGAQALGTFRWQLQPFCNVLTLNVRQDGAVYTLNGFDDQCGAPTQAGVVGTAFLNPDGSIGMGLNSAVAPGAAPVVLYARLNLTTVSGTWNDSAGNSGDFAFTPGPGTGGTARPVPPNGLRPGSVTAGQISPGAIGAAQIAAGTITAAQIALGSITGAQIATGSITAQHLAPGSVQVPLTGSCPPGQYLRGIGADGAIQCEPVFFWPPALSTDADAEAGRESSIAVGPDGLPVISHFNESTRALRVTKCGNPACTGGNVSTNVDASVTGLHSAIAIGADGLPVISHQHSHQDRGTSLRVTHCGNPACTAGNVSTDVDDPPTAEVGRDTAIAIGADGLPVISHRNETTHSLRVTRCGNPACTQDNVSVDVDVSADNVGLDSSMAIGADGIPIISHLNLTTMALRVTWCGNPTCTAALSIDVDDPPAAEVGDWPSIAIGADGLPVIAYRNRTAEALRVMKCGTPDCSAGNVSSNVDDPGSADVGLHTSIAIGTDGLPVISHFNVTASALRVTRCGNSACTAGNSSANVDATTPQDTSIAIGLDGLPVISFRSYTTNRLRVTKCGTHTCQ